jgi:hypothetical protein
MNNSTKTLVVGAVTAVAEVGTLYLAAQLSTDKDAHIPFTLFFPIPTILSIPFLHGWVLAIIAMLAQFPVYGYLVGLAWLHGRLRHTAIRVSAFHGLSAVLGLCSLMISRV